MKKFTLSFSTKLILVVMLAVSFLSFNGCGGDEEGGIVNNNGDDDQTPIWSTKAPMQTARTNFGLAVVGNKIYAIGGMEGNSFLSTVEEYDPATDTWVYKQSLPIKRGNFCTSVVNGKIYVIGGDNSYRTPVATVVMYDPSTDQWTDRGSMLEARSLFGSSVINGKIYVIGGRTNWGGPDSVLLAKNIEVYDPSLNTWKVETEMSPGRWTFCCCVVNGEIYVISGSQSKGLPYLLTTNVKAYNPVNDTWTGKEWIPTGRYDFASCVLDNKIYSMGGLPAIGNNGLSSNEVYDPAADTWTTKRGLPTARLGLSSCTVNNKIYVVGGIEILNGSSIAIVEEYSPDLD